jgi:hypothetical protein
MEVHRLSAAALLVLALAGCAAEPPAAQPQQKPDAQESSGPCDLLSADELADALGYEGDDGDSAPASVTQNDVSWEAQKCRWRSDSLEVSLSVSNADDFAAGEVFCEPQVSLGDDPVALEGLGDSAWFVLDDFADPAGEVRFCTDSTLVDLKAEFTADVDADELRESLSGLAALVADRL